MKVGVLGSGSWATAIVKILTDNTQEKDVNWWIRRPEVLTAISTHGHNPHYLRSLELHMDRVHLSNSIEQVISESDLLVLAIPSAFVHKSLPEPGKVDLTSKSVLSAVKGLIPETSQILGEYLKEYGFDEKNIGVITGPCHAEEVAQEKLSYLTIASENGGLVDTGSALLGNEYIRTVPSDDIYGTEYSAVLKNIYSIAAGICHGMGLGDNFQAVLISNAIRETKRFIAAVHPIERDIDDSAYLGDLMVTAYSTFSRNRTFGNMLGKGYSVKSAQLEMNMVAEGYYATDTIFRMNSSLQVEMPILVFVHNVIYGGKKPVEVFDQLTSKLN